MIDKSLRMKPLPKLQPIKMAEGGEVPQGIEVPEGFEFAGMVDSKYKGPVASFTKQGDDTGFTVYAAEIDYGNNKGQTGYFFDDIGEEVGSAGTGGYLNANDAFNQGRTRSGNYVYHYDQMIKRGIKLDDAAMDRLNAALAHHDKYLGGEAGFDRRRDNLIDTMNAVQNYENYSGQTYNIGETGAQLMPTEPTGPVSEEFRREGVEYVKHDGKMVSADALNALKQSVGLLDQDLRYDADGNGEVDLQDSLAFMKYASGQDVEANTPFFSEFYKEPDTQVTTTAIGEEDGGFPFGEATTMAVGEEDSALPPFKENLPEVTTMAVGEEDGGFNPIDEVTTLAIGEEDGGGGFIKDDSKPVYTTMAVGEEDGGGGGGVTPIDTLPQPDPVAPIEPFPGPRPDNPFLDLIPPADVDPVAPIVTPRPDNPFFDLPVPIDNPIDTMPPVVAPAPRTYGNYTPPTAPVMGAGDQRTYGTTVPAGYSYSYTPVPSLVSASEVDATAALDPLREGLGSFLREGSANYLQSSGPRTSVFTRS